MDLRPVSELRPHEETIESNTREMVAQLKRDGAQKDPIIVDDGTGVVLDGMHRLSAFRELGIGYAACSLVEYASANISLGRWLRVYLSSGDGSPAELAREAGLTRRTSLPEALRELERREAHAAAFADGVAFSPPEPGKADAGFAALRRADAFAQTHGWRRTFVGEEELESHARRPSEVVMMVGPFEKTDVLKAGVTGRLLPCKTSMHLIDPRPVAVKIPIGELKAGSRGTLERRLGEKRFDVLPPNSFYEGRRYKERLLLLSGG